MATTESAETTEGPENLDLDLDGRMALDKVMEDTMALDKAMEDKMAMEMEMEMEKGPLAVCEEYNACVVYLVIFVKKLIYKYKAII